MNSLAPSTIPTRPRWLVPAVVLLFILFFFELGAAAMLKGFWLDETNAIIITLQNSSWKSLLTECLGQASPFPFYYILQKSWFGAWSDAPQSFWNLRFFFRLIPMVAWLVTILAGALWTYQLAVRSEPKSRGNMSASWVALTLTLFFFFNPVGHYYAIEDRPYAVWLLLSTTHFLQVAYAHRPGSRSLRFWASYSLVAALMTWTSGAAIIQFVFSEAFLVLSGIYLGYRSENPTTLSPLSSRTLNSPLFRERFVREAKRCAAVSALPLAIFVFYSLRTRVCDNENSSIISYFGAVKQIIEGSLWIPSRKWTAFVTFPLFSWIYFSTWKSTSPAGSKPSPDRWGFHYVSLMLAATLLYFVGCRIKHVTVAPRHYINLLPVLIWFNWTFLKNEFQRAGASIERRALAWKCVGTALILMGSYQLVSKLHVWREANPYGFSDQPECKKKLEYDATRFNQANALCRGLSHPEY